MAVNFVGTFLTSFLVIIIMLYGLLYVLSLLKKKCK